MSEVKTRNRTRVLIWLIEKSDEQRAHDFVKANSDHSTEYVFNDESIRDLSKAARNVGFVKAMFLRSIIHANKKPDRIVIFTTDSGLSGVYDLCSTAEKRRSVFYTSMSLEEVFTILNEKGVSSISE